MDLEAAATEASLSTYVLLARWKSGDAAAAASHCTEFIQQRTNNSGPSHQAETEGDKGDERSGWDSGQLLPDCVSTLYTYCSPDTGSRMTVLCQLQIPEEDDDEEEGSEAGQISSEKNGETTASALALVSEFQAGEALTEELALYDVMPPCLLVCIPLNQCHTACMEATMELDELSALVVSRGDTLEWFDPQLDEETDEKTSPSVAIVGPSKGEVEATAVDKTHDQTSEQGLSESTLVACVWKQELNAQAVVHAFSSRTVVWLASQVVPTKLRDSVHNVNSVGDFPATFAPRSVLEWAWEHNLNRGPLTDAIGETVSLDDASRKALVKVPLVEFSRTEPSKMRSSLFLQGATEFWFACPDDLDELLVVSPDGDRRKSIDSSDLVTMLRTKSVPIGNDGEEDEEADSVLVVCIPASLSARKELWEKLNAQSTEFGPSADASPGEVCASEFLRRAESLASGKVFDADPKRKSSSTANAKRTAKRRRS